MRSRRGEVKTVTEWLATQDSNVTPQGLLTYWFTKDALPDPKVVRFIDRAREIGIKSVIATNNEARRAKFIWDEMGFGDLVDEIFAAGPIGVAKPDPAFFEYVSGACKVRPDQIMLIDDKLENVHAARELCWVGHFFEHDGYEKLASLFLDLE